MGKTRVQTRVDDDTHDRIGEFRDTNNLSDAEAVRRLLRAGLSAKGHPVTAADGGSPVEKIASPKTVLVAGTLMLFGSFSLAGAVIAPSLAATVALTGAGTLLATVATATMAAAALAQWTLARPLKGLLGAGSEVDA